MLSSNPGRDRATTFFKQKDKAGDAKAKETLPSMQVAWRREQPTTMVIHQL